MSSNDFPYVSTGLLYKIKLNITLKTQVKPASGIWQAKDDCTLHSPHLTSFEVFMCVWYAILCKANGYVVLVLKFIWVDTVYEPEIIS